MESQYRVTNISYSPLVVDWTYDLLDEHYKELYNQFQNSPDYIGRTPEEKTFKDRMPHGIKMEPFLLGLTIGKPYKAYRKNSYGVVEPFQRYGWYIGADYELLLQKPVEVLAEICDKYYISYSQNSTPSQIIENIRNTFGENTKVISSSERKQLLNFEFKEIIQNKSYKPGMTAPKVVNSGYLKFELIPSNEAVSLFVDKKAEIEQKGQEATLQKVREMDYKEVQKIAKEHKIPFVGVSKEKVLEQVANVL